MKQKIRKYANKFDVNEMDKFLEKVYLELFTT